jgi:hypothetical protein
MLYYGFEIITDTAYHMYANANEQETNRAYEAAMVFLGDSVESHARGRVDADLHEDALSMIRAGKWIAIKRGADGLVKEILTC